MTLPAWLLLAIAWAGVGFLAIERLVGWRGHRRAVVIFSTLTLIIAAVLAVSHP